MSWSYVSSYNYFLYNYFLNSDISLQVLELLRFKTRQLHYHELVILTPILHKIF